jgi:hypothetical protein
MPKLFLKSFILLDQGHVFFTFTSVEAEMLQTVGTATNKSIPLRGNSCAVSNHIRKARLKLLTLSSFNHTAGRRFLPFGITAISKWFGDYLSLTTQGDLLCVLKLSYPYVPPQA